MTAGTALAGPLDVVCRAAGSAKAADPGLLDFLPNGKALSGSTAASRIRRPHHLPTLAAEHRHPGAGKAIEPRVPANPQRFDMEKVEKWFDATALRFWAAHHGKGRRRNLAHCAIDPQMKHLATVFGLRHSLFPR
jgi:hypothetical protein